MRNFVGHDAGEFAFSLGGHQQAGINANIATGTCECVDAGIVDHEKGEVLSRVFTPGDQSSAKGIHVTGRFRIIENYSSLAQLAHEGGPHCPVLLGGDNLAGGITQVG